MDIAGNNRNAMALLTAAIVAVVAFPIWIPLLKKLNIMDHPNERKIHKHPIPRMGGVVIYLAFATAVWLFIPASSDTEWQGILLGGGVALAIGCADDIWNISAPVKLMALFALTVLIWRFGIITNLPFCQRCDETHIWVNTGLNLVVTMLWLTGICSAMNALDHMDGLSAGVSIIAAGAYFAVSLQTNQNAWAVISLALIGALAGFLVFNLPPAKVFMGDSGSFFLGFALAAIGIMGGWSPNPKKALIVPIAVLSLPIFDFCHVLISRHMNGTTKSIKEAIVYCGKDHIGHRMFDIGFSKRMALLMTCFVAATAAISALVLRHAHYLDASLLLIQIIMIYVVVAVLMEMARRNSSNSIGSGKADKQKNNDE